MPRIDQLFAYVVADSGPDDEGVPAVRSPTGPMPLIGADVARAASMEDYAQLVANMKGKPVELRVFTSMRTVKVIEPKRAG